MVFVEALATQFSPKPWLHGFLRSLGGTVFVEALVAHRNPSQEASAISASSSSLSISCENTKKMQKNYEKKTESKKKSIIYLTVSKMDSRVAIMNCIQCQRSFVGTVTCNWDPVVQNK
jgi:hypothetical protein